MHRVARYLQVSRTREDFDFEQAHRLFLEHEVAPASDFTFAWDDPDEDGIIKFLVHEKGFNADRVRSTIARLRKARQAGQQQHIDSFFTVLKPAGGAAAATAGFKHSTAKPAGRGGKAKRGRYLGMGMYWVSRDTKT